MKETRLSCWFYGKSEDERVYDIYAVSSTGDGIALELKDIKNKEQGETNWMRIQLSSKAIKRLKKQIKWATRETE